MKLWGGRFEKKTDGLVDDFHSSITFDKRLYHQDIAGSIAHATMLGEQGIIPQADADAIVEGLKGIEADIAAGGFTNATDAADYLVKKGMPFRDAHAVIGHLVLHCVRENKAILDLSLDELKTFSELFEADVYEACSMHACVELRDVPGGPAPNRVEASIKAGQAWLDAFSV